MWTGDGVLWMLSVVSERQVEMENENENERARVRVRELCKLNVKYAADATMSHDCAIADDDGSVRHRGDTERAEIQRNWVNLGV